MRWPWQKDPVAEAAEGIDDIAALRRFLQQPQPGAWLGSSIVVERRPEGVYRITTPSGEVLVGDEVAVAAFVMASRGSFTPRSEF